MATVPSPLPVLPGVYYARVQGSSGRGSISNIFTFKKAGVALADPADATNALLVSEEIAANWPAFANAALSTDYIGTDVSTYPLGSPLVPAQVAPLTAPGGRPGDLAPVTSAFVIAHTVERRGRGSQSRTNMSPLDAAIITPDGSKIITAEQSPLQAAFTTFIANVITALSVSSSGSWAYVQLSKHPTPATFLISNSNVELPLSTQRRRARRP